MKIWELTECVIDYNCTPDVIKRWTKKPSLEAIANEIGVCFPSRNDETTLKVVKLWQGEEVQFTFDGLKYALEQVPVEEN